MHISIFYNWLIKINWDLKHFAINVFFFLLQNSCSWLKCHACHFTETVSKGHPENLFLLLLFVCFLSIFFLSCISSPEFVTYSSNTLRWEKLPYWEFWHSVFSCVVVASWKQPTHHRHCGTSEIQVVHTYTVLYINLHVA